MNILSAFETDVKLKENRLELEHKIMTLLHKTCDRILQHELTRTQTAESEALDNRFLAALSSWQNACGYNFRKIDLISAVEERMMRLHVSDWSQDLNWVSFINF